MGWQDIVRQVTEDPSPARTEQATLREIERHLRSISNGVQYLTLMAIIALLLTFGSAIMHAMEPATPRPPHAASTP